MTSDMCRSRRNCPNFLSKRGTAMHLGAELQRFPFPVSNQEAGGGGVPPCHRERAGAPGSGAALSLGLAPPPHCRGSVPAMAPAPDSLGRLQAAETSIDGTGQQLAGHKDEALAKHRKHHHTYSKGRKRRGKPCREGEGSCDDAPSPNWWAKSPPSQHQHACLPSLLPLAASSLTCIDVSWEITDTPCRGHGCGPCSA